MTSVGYARVSSIGQELDVQIDKLAMCERVFKEKQSAVDTDRPELRRCLDYLRDGDTLLVTKYARLLGKCLKMIGLDASFYGTHSLRRTKATLIYKKTGNLRVVQLLLGHTKVESTVRYLRIEVDDALAVAEQIDV